MSFSRLVLLAITCSSIFGAATPNTHSLYFEQRSPNAFNSHTATESVVIKPGSIDIEGVSIRFVHASSARLEGFGPSSPSTYVLKEGTAHFLQYPKVRIRGVYAGVNAIVYGTTDHLEYDLEFARGARTESARLRIEGAKNIHLDKDGTLVIATESGQMRQLAPHVFEQSGDTRREISAHYVLLGHNEVGFHLSRHDPKSRLTIDPVIVYQKYFGGSSYDAGGPIATDSAGNLYMAGSSNSVDFPSTNGATLRVTPPLLAYSNAGQTVAALPVGKQTSVTAVAGTPDGGVIYAATPNGIFVSGDHGASFTQTAALPKAASVQAISVDRIDPSRAFVATNAGLFATASAGQTWGENDFGFAVAGGGIVNAASVLISPLDHTVIFATTAFPNYLYRTTNAGANWQQLNPAYPGEPPVPQFTTNNLVIALSPDGKTLYVVDANGFLLQSIDNGNTWTLLAGQLFGAQSITIDPANPSHLYIVFNARLYFSADGGHTFSVISPTLANGDRLVGFAQDGSGALYVSTSSINFYVSRDNGATWATLPRRPNIHALVSLGGQVFAAADSPSVSFVSKWSPDGARLLYSTFFGGSYFDSIRALQVDAQGEAVIAGSALSSDFPVTQTISVSPPPYASAFVAKLSADGSQALYSTLLGASQGATVNALALDPSGAPYITGTTPSPDFPTTPQTVQPKVPAATCQRPNNGPLSPIGNLGTFGFVSKLSSDGKTLAYSTFLAGACGSSGQGIAVDAAGDAVVVGYTNAPDFPVSPSAYQSTFPGGLTATTAFPNPTDFGFVTKLSPAADKVIASTFVGGGFHSEADAVALDSAGNTYVTGSTWGITPGPTPGAYQSKIVQTCIIFGFGPPLPPSGGSDAFLLKLDPNLSTARYLTYLGGGCDDAGHSLVVTANGNVWLAGQPSSGFPLVSPYAQPGAASSFVSELSADASQLLYSTYSDGQFLAVDPSGAIYVSGSGTAIGGAVKNQGFSSSVSLTKLDPSSTRPVVINYVGLATTYQTGTNASSPQPTIIAPGELIAITGQHLGPATTLFSQLDAVGHIPFSVNATTVSFNGYLAPILSVQDGLIVCIAPFEISGPTELTVKVDGQSSDPVRVGVSTTAPYILDIVNQDGTLNGPSHPAPQGSVLTIYVTGLGITTPLSQDGEVNTFPLPAPAVTIITAIGGNQMKPQFAGAAPGLVAGITQVNVQVPVANYTSNPVTLQVNNAAAALYITQ